MTHKDGLKFVNLSIERLLLTPVKYELSKNLISENYINNVIC
jgi:hypothetical protein